MKRIYLQKINQKGNECYIGKVDPRKLIRIVEQVEMGETQEAQRPLNAKRVKEIANYIASDDSISHIGGGILPNTLTLATKDCSFEVKTADDIPGIYYIEFPETEDEIKKYINTILVMDGQHRLHSFRKDVCLLPDNVEYEIGFTLYIHPDLAQQRTIFITCNEKQEKVNNNLLMWFRSKLEMLNSDEKKFYNLVSKLNENTPLKGHIIMSAEKIKLGVKASEIMKVLDKAKIDALSQGNNILNDDNKAKAISVYLMAWEKVVGFSFSKPSSKSGAAVKMSGLRFMLILLPSIWRKAIQSKQKFTVDYVKDILARLISSFGVRAYEFFTCESNKTYFTERTNTEKFAEIAISKIAEIDSEDFNPLA